MRELHNEHVFTRLPQLKSRCRENSLLDCPVLNLVDKHRSLAGESRRKSQKVRAC
jgi:hypothetical protein